MKPWLLLLLFSLLQPASAAGPGVGVADDPAWQELFSHLAPTSPRQCAFEERRYFPFRARPVVLTGTVRIAPGRGLSLEYATPARRTVIIDGEGILVRESGGQRAAPAQGRAQAATAALAAILRFDPAELARDFKLDGTLGPDAWKLTLIPREPGLAESLESVSVDGVRGRLGRIELVRSAAQRIEIVLGPATEGIAFSADTLARAFR